MNLLPGSGFCRKADEDGDEEDDGREADPKSALSECKLN